MHKFNNTDNFSYMPNEINDEVSFVYPENANHVLKHEESPRESLTAQYASLHYNAPDAELDREAEDAIINWLKEKFHPLPSGSSFS
jgi:hypothetical protein